MKSLRLHWLFFVLVTIGSAACGQPDAPVERDRERLTDDLDRYTRLADLPRHFEGTFNWENGTTTQEVEVWFEHVSLDEDGRTWIARGRAVYRTSHVTRIDVRARIRPVSGMFRMWESNPDTPGFETDGVHEGRISNDFEKIEATWHGADGQRGWLSLVAVSPP
jgi:hypothetical protein